MREPHVRPVIRATEPRPEWIAVWRFRFAALVVLALLTWAVVWLYNHFVTGASRQDPGIGDALPATAPPFARASG